MLFRSPRLMKTNSAFALNPKSPRYVTSDSSWRQGRDRLAEALEKFELWDEIIAIAATPHFDDGDRPEDATKRARALALAWLNKGDFDRASKEVARLDEIADSIRVERQAGVDSAELRARKENKNSADITKAMHAALDGFTSRLDEIEKVKRELNA